MSVRPLERKPAGVHGEVERLLEALQAGVDSIVEEMVDTIVAEIPAYGRPFGRALAEDIREHCGAQVTLMIQTLRQDREPASEDLGFARHAAARRVRQGIPLEALLQAFRLGHRTVWDATLRLAPDTPRGRDAALILARPAMQYIDVVSTHVAESYLKEEQRSLATADRERRDLLENLLAGRLPAAGDGPPSAAGGLRSTAELLVAVGRISSPGPADPNAPHRAADVLAVQLASPRTEPLIVVRQGEIVAVIPADDVGADPIARLRSARSVLAERRAIDVRIGVSARFTGLAGVAQGYGEARQALLRTSEQRALVALDELSAFDYLVATADPAAWHVARRTASILLGPDLHRDAALSDTIMAYVECDLRVAEAARRLAVHPNTVRYRLRKVAVLTGRDPLRFQDLVELATVIRMARARDHPPLAT